MSRYLEHRRRYIEYRQAQEDLNNILNEWILAFQRTIPKITYGDRVQGNPTNKVEEYVIELENKQLRQRQQIADAYTAEIDRLLDLYPLQWFNYSDPWVNS